MLRHLQVSVGWNAGRAPFKNTGVSEMKTQTELDNIPHLKRNLQSVFRHLEYSSFSQLPRHTHPGVSREHGATQLLTRNDHHMIRHHCRTKKKRDKSEERTPDRHAEFHGACVTLLLQLTDCGEDVGEAEVINGIKRQQMIEKLFLLVIAAQEGIALIQLPAAKQKATEM